MPRPPKYSNPEDLQVKIDEYFNFGHNKRKVTITVAKEVKVVEIPILTITGLVRYCGFESRQTFYDLEKQLEFSYTIKKARNRIEEEYEELLQRGLGAGAIFALKNFGWVDKQEVEHIGKGDQKVVVIVQEKDGDKSKTGRLSAQILVEPS